MSSSGNKEVVAAVSEMDFNLVQRVTAARGESISEWLRSLISAELSRFREEGSVAAAALSDFNLVLSSRCTLRLKEKAARRRISPKEFALAYAKTLVSHALSEYVDHIVLFV